MSTSTGKTVCPKCRELGRDRSGDNLALYENGGYCFACGYVERDGGDTVLDSAFIQGGYRDLTSRKITEKTCRHFGYQVGVDKNGAPVQIANYFSTSKELLYQKLRYQDKKFVRLGGKESVLFGSWLYNSTDKTFIVLTEGEIDAMTVAQVMGLTYPVVSLPDGASSAAKVVAANLEYLEGFKYIVLCLDEDAAGQKAREEICKIISPSKLRIATLPAKDANELLVAGKVEELRSAIWNAVQYKPKCVLTFNDLTSLKDYYDGRDEGTVISWPWEGLNKLMGPLKLGHVYILGAAAGAGKTTFVQAVFYSVIEHGEKAMIIGLESTPTDLIDCFTERLRNEKGFTYEQMLEYINDKLYLYNRDEGLDTNTIIGRIKYCVKHLGIKYFLLDNLTALVAVNEAEVKAIDKITIQLQNLCEQYNCTIISVAHLAKPSEGKSYEAGAEVYPSSFRGSQSLQYFASYMIALERNKVCSGSAFRDYVKVKPLKIRDKRFAKNEFDAMYLQYEHSSAKLIEIDKQVYDAAKAEAELQADMNKLF